MKKSILKILDKTMSRCAYCGVYVNGNGTIDHIIPKSIFDHMVFYKIGVPDFLSHLTVGQSDHEDNLFPSCKSCNEYKGDLDIETFRKKVAQSVNRLYKKSIEYRVSKRFGLLVEHPKIKIEFYFETISDRENLQIQRPHRRQPCLHPGPIRK